MEVVLHRRNTLEELESSAEKYGIEVDVRVHNGELVCQHDPFQSGVPFAVWLNSYRHKLLIVNVKEEGLETSVEELLQKNKIDNYFFLDQSFPYIIKTINRGNNRAAIRISEFENYQTAISLAGKAQWLWVDVFSKFPLGENEIKSLKDLGYKFCVVSPELHGRHDPDEVKNLRQLFENLKFVPDAVCTKSPSEWGR